MSDVTTNTLLLEIISQMGEIKGDIGGIKQQLLIGADRHREFTQQLDMIESKTDIIENEIFKINEILVPSDGVTMPIVTRVKNLEIFMGRNGAVLATATTIMISAITLIGWGISTFKSDIMSLFKR